MKIIVDTLQDAPENCAFFNSQKQVCKLRQLQGFEYLGCDVDRTGGVCSYCIEQEVFD